MDDYVNELDMNDQAQIRLSKLNEIRALGADPYPARSARTHTAQDAIAVFEEWEAAEQTTQAEQPVGDGEPVETRPNPAVTIVGRLRLRRAAGKATFAHIEDESGRVQL